MTSEGIPSLTNDQMREVDRLMIEKYGINLLIMMENAGRNLADHVQSRLNGSVKGKDILVASGKGNNGGGGLAAARHLHNRGAQVTIAFPEGEIKEAPSKQLGIMEQLDVEIKRGVEIKTINKKAFDLAVDAVVGYGLNGDPRGWPKKAINLLNGSGCPIISLDVPSGLDPNTGKAFNPCVRASSTLTLALPKIGLLEASVMEYVGDLYLADISVPNELYHELGFKIGKIFEDDRIILLTRSEDKNGGNQNR